MRLFNSISTLNISLIPILVYCFILLPIQANWNHHRSWQHGALMCKSLGFMIMFLPVSCAMLLAYGSLLDYIDRIYLFAESTSQTGQSNLRQISSMKPVTFFAIDVLIPTLILVLGACLSVIGYNYYELIPEYVYTPTMTQKNHCILSLQLYEENDSDQARTLFTESSYQLTLLARDCQIDHHMLLYVPNLGHTCNGEHKG